MAREECEEEDRWERLEYGKFRFLDAVANVFAINWPCTAAAKLPGHSEKIFLSFNSSCTEGQAWLARKISDALERGNAAELFFLKLTFDESIKKKIDATVQIYESSSDSDTPFDKLLSFFRGLKRDTNFLKSYSCKTDTASASLEKIKTKFERDVRPVFEENEILIKFFIREIQDITKLLTFLHSSGGGYDWEFRVIDNVYNHISQKFLHAELNISFVIGKDVYRGISLLCCGDCHESLEAAKEDTDHLNHRGSHFRKYKNWINPDNPFDLKPTHGDETYDDEAATPLDRKDRSLSIDEEFEPAFLVDLRNGEKILESFELFIAYNPRKESRPVVGAHGSGLGSGNSPADLLFHTMDAAIQMPPQAQPDFVEQPTTTPLAGQDA